MALIQMESVEEGIDALVVSSFHSHPFRWWSWSFS